MASLRFVTRRIRNLFSQPLVQIAAVCIFLFFFISFVIKHNHDDDLVRLAPVPRPTASVDAAGIDWSKLYYVQYVTSPEYLCNALMVWAKIEEIGSRAQRMMLYPSHWDPNEIDEEDEEHGPTPIARLLQQAQTSYFVKLRPVEVLHQNHSAQATWADSYTKLLAFNLTEFDRVLTIDSDSNVKANLDDLFLLPKAPVAMPYVYWGSSTGWAYSSQMMLITPSASEFERVSTAIVKAKKDEYDMDIINNLFRNKILRIPQRPYNLLSGEFRRNSHVAYLQSHSTKWDPDAILAEAKFMHFSDWPIPKPWVRAKKEELNKYMPKCDKSEWYGASDCRDRTIWLGLYMDFAMRRKAVCGAGFELQSRELPENSIFRHGKWIHPDDVG